MRTRCWIWVDLDTGGAYTESTTPADGTAPRCPKCGEKTVYWEGQIDEDFMGNHIDGYSYHCYACFIGTLAVEI